MAETGRESTGAGTEPGASVSRFTVGDERTRELARRAGAESVRVRRAKAVRLDLAAVEAALGPLTRPENVRAWLEWAGRQVAAGVLTAAQGGVLAKVCGEWTRSYDQSEIEHQLADTATELKQVKANLAAERKRRGVRGVA